MLSVITASLSHIVTFSTLSFHFQWLYTTLQLINSASFTSIVYTQHQFYYVYMRFFSFACLADNSGYGQIVPQTVLSEVIVAIAVLFFQIMSVFIFTNIIGLFYDQYNNKK